MSRDSRSWRRWLRGLVDDLAADEWERASGPSGHDEAEEHGGAHASLDEILREATEAREPHREDGPSAT